MKRFLAVALLFVAASLVAQQPLSFTVIGIDCAACAGPITRALESVSGVQNVQLDWKSGKATVAVPPGFHRETVRKALTSLGFAVAFPGEVMKEVEELPDSVVKTLDIQAYPGTSKVDIPTILVPGKVTIVDFYADWCGPCHVLEIRLQHLMNGRKDLALRRLNIGKWDNEAAKQATREFRAEALPYIRVYDAKGKFVGAVTGGMWDEVLAVIEKADSRG